jgi:hypothetical protein
MGEFTDAPSHRYERQFVTCTEEDPDVIRHLVYCKHVRTRFCNRQRGLAAQMFSYFVSWIARE